MNRLYSLISFLLLSVLISACSDDSVDLNCETVKCEDSIGLISIKIVDNNGDPVLLDDYYSFIDSRTRFQETQKDYAIRPGWYPVATNEQYDLFNPEGTILIFVGIVNERNVVEHQMLIGKDCCSIELLTGDTEIVIKNE